MGLTYSTRNSLFRTSSPVWLVNVLVYDLDLSPLKNIKVYSNLHNLTLTPTTLAFMTLVPMTLACMTLASMILAPGLPDLGTWSLGPRLQYHDFDTLTLVLWLWYSNLGNLTLASWSRYHDLDTWPWPWYRHWHPDLDTLILAPWLWENVVAGTYNNKLMSG